MLRASADVDCLAGDVAAGIAGEVDGHLGDRGRRDQGAQHVGAHALVIDLLVGLAEIARHVLVKLCRHLGLDPAGTDRVDPDVVLSHLGGKTAHERTDQAVLGRVVGGPLRIRRLGVGGRVEELHAARALLNHRRQRVLRDQVRRLQVDGHDPVPHGLVHVDDLLDVGDPGVVHDHVDAAEPLDGGLAHRLDGRGVGQIGRRGEGLAAGIGDGVEGLRRPFLAARVDRDRRPFSRVGLGDGAPDAACRASNPASAFPPVLRSCLSLQGCQHRDQLSLSDAVGMLLAIPTPQNLLREYLQDKRKTCGGHETGQDVLPRRSEDQALRHQPEQGHDRDRKDDCERERQTNERVENVQRGLWARSRRFATGGDGSGVRPRRRSARRSSVRSGRRRCP